MSLNKYITLQANISFVFIVETVSHIGFAGFDFAATRAAGEMLFGMVDVIGS
jgi:hypothetical protein